MDLDKLFSEMESEPRTVEVNCEIDNDLRIVTVPSDSMVFGVEHDKDINTIHFTMNKMYRGIDLSDFSVRVTYKNANDEINFSEVNDVEKQENTFMFSWTVPNFACLYQGVIQFAINFLKYDDEGKVLQAYNTTIAKGNCLIGLYVDSSDVPEGQYDDLISELNSLLIRTGNTQVDRVKNTGNSKIDEIETANAHSPQINSATGYWQTWDAETGEYVDTTTKAEGPKGDKGETGATPQLTIGTVTTLDPGEDATANITGTAEAPVLSLGIPKGVKGDTGAPGMSSAEFDAMFAALLDGKNTTQLFWLWWPATVSESATKYQRLERWFGLLGNAWQDKTYTVRFYNPDVSGDYNGTPMDDLADGREAAPLVTDASEPVEDWAENDPMTWYIRGNALSLDGGTMNILALEGEDGFDLSGETAPVYCFALSTAVWERKDENYLYKSWHTKPGGDYLPMAESVAPDGSYRLMTWHPAFYGGARADGGITSGAGKLPMSWTSAIAALPLVRRVSAYEGEWTDCDQQYALAQWQLRHWTLSNSGKAEGCTSYNYQYKLAAGETGVKRLLVTPAQGENFLAGSCVCLGNQGDNTNNDRNQSYNHDIFTAAKILSVETVDVGEQQYTALNLDIAETIDTTASMLVSTMAWPSGTTEVLQGHSDGCIGNLTSGKYPYRVAGVEMQIGIHCESLEPLWQTSIVEGKWHYDVYSVRDAAKQTTSITGDYELTGSFDLADAFEYKQHYIKELNALTAESMEPVAVGGSSSTYLRAAFSSPSALGGLRCPWRGGNLANGDYCGLPSAAGNPVPHYSLWSGGPRLAGAGKTRGIWGGDTE